MKRKKLLILAATSVLLTVLLTVPAVAAEQVEITVTDNPPANSQSAPPTAGDLPQQQTIPYPTDIQLLEQGARNYLYKTYTVAANYNPDLLIEASFSQGGYRYRYSEIIQRESTPASDSKTVTQTKTISCDTDNQAEVLSLLGSTLPYSDADGYQGELFLLPESLIISETGREPYSYTLTETKEFSNLESNDMSFIPKTTVKNGVTLILQNVDWQATESAEMGYSEVASSYNAVAYYSATASGTKATGYSALASFSGNVVKPLVGKNTYTIVYEGEQIIIPFNFAPLIAMGAIIAGCIVAAVMLWRVRKNVTIYTLRQGVPELFGKVRVSPKNPVLDLSRLTDVGVRLVFDKRFVKALYDQKVFVIGKYTNYRINITGSLVQELPAQRLDEGVSETDSNQPSEASTSYRGNDE